MSRFQAGDPLRGVAATGVIVYHVAFIAAETTGHGWFTDAYGSAFAHAIGGLELGLWIFFALSGYLIGGPFVRAYVDGRPMPRVLPYTRNRLLRIVPAFWVITTLLLLVHGTYGASPGDVASIYLFTQVYDNTMVSFVVGPAWSLDIEVAFYALVPLVAWATYKLTPPCAQATRIKVLALALGGVWVASLALRELTPDTLDGQRFVPAMLFAFVPGIVLALLEHTGRERLARLRRPALVTGAMASCGIALFAVHVLTAPERTFPPLPGALPGVLASLAGGLVVGAALVWQWNERPLPRALDWRPWHWIGERSYGLYLLHQGVLVELTQRIGFSDDPVVRMVQILLLGVPICLVMAAAIYATIERPLLQRKERWRTPARLRFARGRAVH